MHINVQCVIPDEHVFILDKTISIFTQFLNQKVYYYIRNRFYSFENKLEKYCDFLNFLKMAQWALIILCYRCSFFYLSFNLFIKENND